MVSSVICVLKITLYDLMHNSVSTSSTAVHIIYQHTSHDWRGWDGSCRGQDLAICRLSTGHVTFADCCMAGRDFVIAGWINWSTSCDGIMLSRWSEVPVYHWSGATIKPAPSLQFELTLKIKSFFPYRSSFSWAWIFLDCKGKIRK